MKGRPQRLQARPIFFLPVRGGGQQVRQLHVDVANLAKRTTEPSNPRPKALDRPGQITPEQAQHRPKLSCGDAHLVQGFYVVTLSNGRLLLRNFPHQLTDPVEGELTDGATRRDGVRRRLRGAAVLQLNGFFLPR